MQGFLVLETGEIYQGFWHGGRERAGEVVFNTSHSGYEEMATDPSYLSQIIVMTAPMQGNYGIDRKIWESRKIWIEGFVCVQMQRSSRDSSWQNLLIDHGVPCLSEVDTRSLVLRLRSGGTVWGALVQAFDLIEAKDKALNLIEQKKKIEKDWVYIASRKEVEDRQGQNPQGPRIAVMDFGAKENILRELELRSSALRIFPSRATAEDILKWQPDGIMLTNGPGDPRDVQSAPEVIKKLIGNIPIYGICMGHQVLSLAIGAQIYKLKFGHRGSNHPIKDDLLEEVYMTSQNHGYAVDGKTLPADAKVTHTNLNDQTVAGFYSEKKQYLGIQYHPESRPGPHEAVKLFDFFINQMVRRKH
jgi:carbamoyl-phosphate synthase small subunit